MHRIWRAAVVIAFIGVAAALVATVAGLVLADIYRPHAPGFPVAELPDPLRRSDQWTDWHRIVGAVLVVAAVVSLALVVALPARGKAAGRRKVLLIGVAAVAALTSVVTVITRPLVEWDQLALWSVTVGSDIDGYWTAAFGEDVRFVLMGNVEVSQAEYGTVLIAHLAAPAVAAGALLLIGLALVRRREDDVTSEAVSTA
ncbi:MAG: hypothetical protein ACT452_14865 [Microthrixaceae bacterium]